MLKKKILYIGIIVASLMLIIGMAYNDNQKVFSAGHLEGKLTVCTSLYPMHIMALNITANIPGIRLVNVTSPESGCLHNAHLSVTDMKLLDNSDIFIINGSGMEGYLEKVLNTYPNLKIIDASKELHPHHDEEFHSHHDEQHHHHHDINPHTWVSISLAIQQVQSIGEQLAYFDPENGDLYLNNTKQYIAKLEDLRQKMHQELSDLKHRDIVTFHDAFPYFAKEFNLHIVAVVQRNAESEPSARELADTIDLIKANEVKAIFVEPQFPDIAAQTIAKETEAKVYTLDPASSGPLLADAYIEIMEKNLQTLTGALK